MLQTFAIPGVRRYLAGREHPIVIEDIGKKKTALFIIMSSKNINLRFLSALFFSTVLTRLENLADASPGRRLPVPVNMILDEVCSLGQIGQNEDQFMEAIETDRSRGINYILTAQTISRMTDRFGRDRTLDILANCGTHMLIRVHDETTAKYYSNFAGTITTEFSSSRIDSKGAVSFSQSRGRRDLMDPSEIRRILRDYMLVFMVGYNPLRVKPIMFTELSSYPYMEKHRTPVATLPPADLTEYAMHVEPTFIGSKNAGEDPNGGEWADARIDDRQKTDPIGLGSTRFDKGPNRPSKAPIDPDGYIAHSRPQNVSGVNSEAFPGAFNATPDTTGPKVPPHPLEYAETGAKKVGDSVDTNNSTNTGTNINTNNSTNIDTNNGEGGKGASRYGAQAKANPRRQAEGSLYERLFGKDD